MYWTKFLVAALIPLGDHCLNFFNEFYICPETWADKAWFSDPYVLAVEYDLRVYADTCQLNAPWHLHSITYKNRTTQRPLKYVYNDTAAPASTVYVLDTWVDCSHPEFPPGQCQRGAAFNEGEKNNHGTHVAGLVNGLRVGVNRKATVISVQVLDNNGFGSWSIIARGLQWLTDKPPAIINLSITGPGSGIIDQAVELLIKRGWKVVVAAGNDDRDACLASPARVRSAITVGAHGIDDRKADFSNWGACVDIFGPGVDIESSVSGGGYARWSGTSMASPIVAGIWSLLPKFNSSALLRTISQPLLQLPQTPNTTRQVAVKQPVKDECRQVRGPAFLVQLRQRLLQEEPACGGFCTVGLTID